MQPFDLTEGTSPIILAFPHVGTHLPEFVTEELNETGKLLADTDWHVDRLYAGLLEGATTIRANFHRYVIDANRAPSDESLYPGQNTTGLCPTTDFDGEPIYKNGMEPNAEEIEARRLVWHKPYHDALAAQIDRVKAIHGFAILYDCHSIRSHIPFLFEGRLPDFNIGTNEGKTCSKCVEKTVVTHAMALKATPPCSMVASRVAGQRAIMAIRTTGSMRSRWNWHRTLIWSVKNPRLTMMTRKPKRCACI